MDGSGTVSPLIENDALNAGAGVPPTTSIPIRSQSGSRFSLRTQLCKSFVKGGLVGLGAESQRKSPLVRST